ncbi:hypothetical protein [Shimia abyssi]|uniref:Uncharacterized protein n=1 Tax=Shimia abyssi TaxID=1662395 RepID=A0A2P8FK78_9RHOB|nr:hypothetical protein [Shimia abyssi]PSL22095.1 hypothetical protein CLV88_101520 [Shimia abyssi]
MRSMSGPLLAMGHDAGTGNALDIQGWEEWELGEDMLVKSSRGWFCADDYARQVKGQ